MDTNYEELYQTEELLPEELLPEELEVEKVAFTTQSAFVCY